MNSHGDVVVELAEDNLTHAIGFVPYGGMWSEPLRVGDEIEVAPGDLREIRRISEYAGTAQKARLNDLRQILFVVGFTDGEEAIVRLSESSTPATPAIPGLRPAAWAALGALILTVAALGMRSRRVSSPC